MSQKTSKTITVFLSTLVLSGAVFSAQSPTETLAKECRFLSTSLWHLASENTNEYCFADVELSGFMMLDTAYQIRVKRIGFALDNLDKVQGALKRVRLNFLDCRNLASKIEPYLEKTNTFIHELEPLIQVVSH